VRWSTPQDLRDQVTRLWNRGRILSDLVEDGDLFPLRLRLRTPSSLEWSSRFEEARAWARELDAASPLRIVRETVRHPALGENRFPSEAWLDSREGAVAWIGKESQLLRFGEVLETTRSRCPDCLPWLVRQPLAVLDHSDAWDRLFDVVLWLRGHPRPAILLRELDLPGIDTKFVEAHRSVLSELLDFALPTESVDSSASGASAFEARYGFREKPRRVRLRWLDPDGIPGGFAGATDIELDSVAFAAWDPADIRRVFVVENEVTFLAFPEHPRSIVLFGSGYGFAALREARWVRDREVFYWGDLDTHGFAILDGFRSTFPHARSFLMDRATLLSHRSFWVRENRPSRQVLNRLGEDEQALYADLAGDVLGEGVRLEQERIAFGRIRDFLAGLPPCA
jgi:hypothetical protein